MRRGFLIIILVFLNGIVLAFQSGISVIKGKVTDYEGNLLPGAGISIDKTFIGVQAGSDGYYSIPLLKDGTYSLKVTFLGYITKVIEVNLKGEAFVNIILEPKSFLTEEVLISATRAGIHSPLAYSSIEREELKKLNSGHDMPYLLSLTPSLVETSEAGNGVGYTSLRIRGTDGSRINVTVDGIPLNDPESQQVFWVDLPDLASSVDNIQVQRGAGTSSNGAGAFGATISIQTVSAENEPYAEVNSSAGSFNTFKNMVSAGTGLLSGKFAVQMRYSDLRSDGYIDRTGSDHRSAFLSGLYRSEKSRLKANIILGEEHTGIGWWGVPKDSLNANRTYNPAGEYTDESGRKLYYNNESDNYKQNHYQLIYNLNLTNNISLNTALHYTRGRGYYEEYREDQLLSDYGLPEISLADTLISESDMIRRKWMSNDFYGVVYSVKYKNNKIEAIAGGAANLYLGDHFGELTWMEFAGNTEKDYRWYMNNSRKGEVSIYGKINYSVSDKAAVFGDLQYRNVFYNMSGLDDDLRDIGQEHRFGFFNPKAGLFLSISPGQDTYLSFAVANREPTRSDFKEASGDLNATPKHETLYDTEMGYSLRRAKSSFAVNLYGMIYKNQLVPTGELSDVGYAITTNVDNSYRFGIELSGGLKPADFIEWDLNMTLSKNKIRNFIEYYVDYNSSDWSSEYLSKNLGQVDIAYSPSLIGTSDIAFRISKGLNLHLISKYVGIQYIDNTMDKERMIDPYFVNNLILDYLLSLKNIKGIEFQFILNNIFNEIYESNGYGGNWYEDGNEKSWAYYFPQAGINFMLKGAVKF